MVTILKVAPLRTVPVPNLFPFSSVLSRLCLHHSRQHTHNAAHTHLSTAMPPVDPAASGEATHGSAHRSLVSTPYRVADSRCGVGADGSVFAAPDGTSPAQCNAAGDFPCCSKFGHCGSSAEHCACSDCVDYRLVGRESRPNRAAAGTPDAAACLLYTSPSPRDLSTSRMPSSA